MITIMTWILIDFYDNLFPTISCPKFQYAVRMSTRARGMVNKQRRISEMARFAMKTFRVVIISWILSLSMSSEKIIIKNGLTSINIYDENERKMMC